MSSTDRFVLIHELSGTQDGPFTRQQINKLIFKRKVKRNSKIEVVGRDGLYKAKDLFPKAFEAADRKRAEDAATAKAEKQNAKEEKRAAKLKAKQYEAEAIAASDASDEPPMIVGQPWKSPSSPGKAEGNELESARKFVNMCDQFVSLIRVVGWLSAAVAILVSVSPILSLQNTSFGVNVVFAIGTSVVLLVATYIVIEFSVLTLRFMRETVSLLALQAGDQ